MSTQPQVNASAAQYILYYINVEQKDTGVYNTDLSGVCTLAFGDGDIIICNDWTLGGSYPAPSNSTLLGYNPADVLSWYDGYYLHPGEIASRQPMSLTSAKLALLRTSSISVGYVIYNATTQKQQRWSGSAWVDLW